MLVHLEASIADLRLSDEERRELVSLLRASAMPEEGLRRVRNRAFELVRERLGVVASPDALALLKWLDGVARALDAARGPAALVRSEAYFSPGESDGKKGSASFIFLGAQSDHKPNLFS